MSRGDWLHSLWSKDWAVFFLQQDLKLTPIFVLQNLSSGSWLVTLEIALNCDKVVNPGSFIPSPIVDSMVELVLVAETVQDPIGSASQWIMTIMPEDLPQQLQELIRLTGLGSRMIRGARLLMNSFVIPRWSMDFSVDLSDEEGEAIFGILISD